MATAHNNLSEYDFNSIPSGANQMIGIVVSEWNNDITEKLLQGAIETLTKHDVSPESIIVQRIPGTFELPLAAQWMFENSRVDAIICIGVVIQGDTKHFDFVCQGATQGIMDVGLKFSKPTIYCVLTDNNKQQSIDRSGGKHGNKGIECAVSCLKMLGMKRTISNLNSLGYGAH